MHPALAMLPRSRRGAGGRNTHLWSPAGAALLSSSLLTLDLQRKAKADLQPTFRSFSPSFSNSISPVVSIAETDLAVYIFASLWTKPPKKKWDKEDDEDKVEKWCCRTSNGPSPLRAPLREGGGIKLLLLAGLLPLLPVLPRAPLREVSKRGMRKWAAMLLMGPMTLLSSCKVK